jgi:hypothetical protein
MNDRSFGSMASTDGQLSRAAAYRLFGFKRRQSDPPPVTNAARPAAPGWMAPFPGGYTVRPPPPQAGAPQRSSGIIPSPSVEPPRVSDYTLGASPSPAYYPVLPVGPLPAVLPAVRTGSDLQSISETEPTDIWPGATPAAGVAVSGNTLQPAWRCRTSITNASLWLCRLSLAHETARHEPPRFQARANPRLGTQAARGPCPARRVSPARRRLCPGVRRSSGRGVVSGGRRAPRFPTSCPSPYRHGPGRAGCR